MEGRGSQLSSFEGIKQLLALIQGALERRDFAAVDALIGGRGLNDLSVPEITQRELDVLIAIQKDIVERLEKMREETLESLREIRMAKKFLLLLRADERFVTDKRRIAVSA